MAMIQSSVPLKIAESRDVEDFLAALRVVRNFTGFGVVTIELKHGDVTDVSVTTHHKPQKNRIEANA